MILVSDIVTGVYQLLGRPAQADLRFQDVIDHTRDVVNETILDLKLSARNHKLQSSDWETPGEREEDTSLFVGDHPTNIIPVKMEWRYLSAAAEDPIPYKAEIVAYEELYELARTSNGETYAAFYNDMRSIAFSEQIDTLVLRQYRLWYETMDSESITALTSEAGLPEIFVSYCKYTVALVCLDQNENLTERWIEKRERLRPAFEKKIAEWQPRIARHTYTLYGNKKIKRQGFRPRARRNYA